MVYLDTYSLYLILTSFYYNLNFCICYKGSIWKRPKSISRYKVVWSVKFQGSLSSWVSLRTSSIKNITIQFKNPITLGTSTTYCLWGVQTPLKIYIVKHKYSLVAENSCCNTIISRLLCQKLRMLCWRERKEIKIYRLISLDKLIRLCGNGYFRREGSVMEE